MNQTEKDLIKAIRKGDLECIDDLIIDAPQIAKATLKDRKGNPAVYVALIVIKVNQESAEKEKRLKIIKKLLKANYPVNVINRNGNTPLHKAIKKNLTEIITLLVNKGADVNVKNSEGNTPLHEVIKKNFAKEIIKLLAEKGADVNAKNNEGRTPLYVAMGDEESDNTQLFELVLNLEGVNHYACVNASSASHESVKDILLKRTKDTREAISKPAKEMQSLFTTRVRKLNLEVERINQLPVALSATGKACLERMVQENRKLFFSYSWNEDTVSTVPMVLCFQEYAKTNNITYFLDRDTERGIAAIGQNNLEKFMRKATSESNVTIAFINEHYLKSRNCLFEAYQFWDKEHQVFKENFYWIMHPEEMTVYGNAFNVTPYIQHWKNRRDGLEADRKKIDDTLVLGSHIEEAKFLREIGDAIEGMVNYLAGHVYASYENLRKSGYEEILTKAVKTELPNTLSARQSSVKDKVRLHEEQAKELSEDVSRIKSELIQKAQAEIKQQQGILEGQIEQLKQERESLQQRNTVERINLDEKIQKLTDELEKVKQERIEKEQKNREKQSKKEKKIQKLKCQLITLTKQHEEDKQFETQSELSRKNFEESKINLATQLQMLQERVKRLEEEVLILKSEKLNAQRTSLESLTNINHLVVDASENFKQKKISSYDQSQPLESPKLSDSRRATIFPAEACTEKVKRKAVNLGDKIILSDLEKLMSAAGHGEIEIIKQILDQNPYLVHGLIDFTDVKEKTKDGEKKSYKQLTPFQYFWMVCDIEGCEVIKNYLNCDELSAQIDSLEKERDDITLFDMSNTLASYNNYIRKYHEGLDPQYREFLQKSIGEEQFTWSADLVYYFTRDSDVERVEKGGKFNFKISRNKENSGYRDWSDCDKREGVWIRGDRDISPTPYVGSINISRLIYDRDILESINDKIKNYRSCFRLQLKKQSPKEQESILNFEK